MSERREAAWPFPARRRCYRCSGNKIPGGDRFLQNRNWPQGSSRRTGLRGRFGPLATPLLLAGPALTLVLTLMLTSVASPQDRQRNSAPIQPRPQSSDWVKDNLDLVSASAKEIRDVLSRDHGLMVELKRLMAREAAERGQIVAEEDLEDAAIFERLDGDSHFRALATRLLQRYGYFTPRVNPNSILAQEQDLLLRARAQRLGAAPSRANPTAQWPKPECKDDEDSTACEEQSASYPAMRQAPTVEACGAGQDEDCDTNPQEQDRETPGIYATPPVPTAPRPPEQQPAYPPDDNQTPADQNSPNLLTASMVRGTGTSSTNSNSRETGSGEAPNSALAQGYYAQSQPGSGPSDNSALEASGATMDSSEYYESPEYSRGSPERPRSLVAMNQRTKLLPPREPVEMLRSPNPYAYVPSLYDLYVQAAPEGTQLERFGLAAFRHTPRSMGIPMDLPAGPDYVLGPGDGVTVDLWGSVSHRLFRRVDREGRLLLPEVGPLLVSGKTLGNVQEVVQHVLRSQYRDVSADVSLTRLRTVRVYVVGEVMAPGAYDVSSLSTPLNAIWAAGGVTPRGSLRLVRHTRGSQIVEQVDLYDLLLRGVRGDLKNLENGDTLLVPPVGPQVKVDGMVRRPAIYELHGETDLAQVLELAGGVLPAAALRHIEVQRLEAHEKRTMFGVNVDDAVDAPAVAHQLAAFAVQDGDEVHIYPIAPYNSATVYLQGHVLRPGRYAYNANMRVSDLVGTYADLLPEPASHYGEIIRLRQPDWRPVVESFDLSAALSDPATSPKLEPLDTVRIFGRFEVETSPVIGVTGQVQRPGQYRTSGQMHLRDAIYQAGGLLPDAALDSAQLYRTQSDGSLKILNVNLAAALAADPLENVLVEPRDRIVVHRSLYRVDPPSVYIKGEVANPGRYPLAENMRLDDLLGAAGGPKRGADLANADLMRYRPASSAPPAGEHRKVNLVALAGEPTRNVPLHDGDVLSVPQLPGWASLGASVTVKGEVKNPGVYGIAQGERLSSVLKRAGGLLPAAFPQGTIFTRVSVREMQEKTRQELIQRIQLESPVVRTAVTTSGTEAAALQQQALQQRERVLEGLRQAPVTGRMVVRMQRDLKGFAGSSQDIDLRNGDSIEIPKQPDVVLVIGQVYNTNAITYVPNKNAQWYLGQGGGPTQLADRRATYIVRADGEVVSRRQGGWWSGNVLATMVRPGDTIVVPERVALGDSRWKSILALAQVAEAGAITLAVIP